MIVHEKDEYLVSQIIKPNMKNGPWVAGGAVIQWLVGNPVEAHDIDVFVKDEQQRIDLMNRLSNFNFKPKFETENACTLTQSVVIDYGDSNSRSAISAPRAYYKQIVQVIDKFRPQSAQEVIDIFDLTICQAVTDGHSILFGETTEVDLKIKELNIHRKNKEVVKRLVKYMCYGYSLSKDTQKYINENELNYNFEGGHEYDNLITV